MSDVLKNESHQLEDNYIHLISPGLDNTFSQSEFFTDENEIVILKSFHAPVQLQSGSTFG